MPIFLNFLRGALHLLKIAALIFKTIFVRFLSELKNLFGLCDLIVDLILSPGHDDDDDEVMLNVLRCHLTY